MDEQPDLDLRDAVLELLAEGPLHTPELVERLRTIDAFAPWGSLDDEVAAIVIDEVLADTDETWTTQDDLVVLMSSTLDGTIFTHRVTADELSHGVLHEVPDLVTVAYDDQAETSSPEGELTVEYPLGYDDDVEGVDEHGSLVGPPGWLDGVVAGDVVGLRRRGTTVEVAVLTDDDLADGDAEIEAIRRIHARVAIEGAGVEPVDLLLEALAHDQSLFRSPVAPVIELFERAGLRVEGAFAGPIDQDWLPPGVRVAEQRRAELEATYQFDSCCSQAFDVALGGWDRFVTAGPFDTDPDAGPVTHAGDRSPREISDALDHGPVAPALADWVMGILEEASPLLDDFATAIIESAPGPHTGAHFLRATNAETDGRVLDAEVDFTASLVDDPTYAPALYELARFASDRGDIGRAITLYRRVGPGAQPEVDFLSGLLPDHSHVGRNDPCPCGSGRKFKQCHQDRPEVAADRAALWLFQKLLGYGYRTEFDSVRRGLALAAADLATPGDTDQDTEAWIDQTRRFADEPFILDLALFETGTARRFAEERSVLLPPGEAEMLDGWLATSRRLWEVTDVVPGERMSFRDTASGESVEVAERTASESVEIGDQLLVRIVAVGDEMQLIGQPMPVTLRQRDRVMEMLDRQAGAVEWAGWFGSLHAPPALTNREGEELIAGAAVVRPGEGVAVAEMLDELYERDGESRWTAMLDLGAERIVRAYLDVEDDGRIIVTANSHARMDRVLDELQTADPDLVVEGDERRPVDEREVVDGGAPPVSAVDQAALAEIVQQQELRWLDESIPALQGRTPREAAADPTRREDLLALLREFDLRRQSMPEGAMSFDPDRLRRALGLDS